MVILRFKTKTTTINLNFVQQQHELLLLHLMKNCDKKKRNKINLNRKLSKSFVHILFSDISTDNYEYCNCNMAALPQGAFAARKLRENIQERERTMAHMKSAPGDKIDLRTLTENKKPMEYTPAKYNEKLMNSIWGLYNRYSPHNIKSTNTSKQVETDYMQQQQHSTVVAGAAIAQNYSMAANSQDAIWRFLGK